MNRSASGFTIVELLIVIVIIAALAAMSFGVFTGIQNRAIATTVKSDLANFAKKIEIAKIDSADGLYPAVPTAAMGMEVTKSAYKTDDIPDNNWIYCTSPDRTAYNIGVLDKNSKRYHHSSKLGLTEGYPVSLGQVCVVTDPNGTLSTYHYSNGYTWNMSTSTGTWSAWTN